MCLEILQQRQAYFKNHCSQVDGCQTGDVVLSVF